MTRLEIPKKKTAPLLFMPTSFELSTGLPAWFAAACFFIFGCLIGSFLNVVIYRVPRSESVVLPDSKCPNCGYKIRFYDNVPILSWLLLAGKCRACRAPISVQYPLVEALTGLLYLTTFFVFGFSPDLVLTLVLVSAIVPLVFIDAVHMILPDVITYPLLAFALITRVFYPAAGIASGIFSDINSYPVSLLGSSSPVVFKSILCAILGALVGGGSLWAIGKIWKLLRGVEGMGFGDVKMMWAVGALLGWQLAGLSIFLGAASGAAAGMFLISRQKEKDFAAQIPFGIFLGAGSLLALFFGDHLIACYLTLIPR